jgi:hypothetical protein
MSTPQDKALASINGAILGALGVIVVLCAWMMYVEYFR